MKNILGWDLFLAIVGNKKMYFVLWIVAASVKIKCLPNLELKIEIICISVLILETSISPWFPENICPLFLNDWQGTPWDVLPIHMAYHLGELFQSPIKLVFQISSDLQRPFRSWLSSRPCFLDISWRGYTVRIDSLHWDGQRDLGSAFTDQLTGNQTNAALYELSVEAPANKSTFH